MSMNKINAIFQCSAPLFLTLLILWFLTWTSLKVLPLDLLLRLLASRECGLVLDPGLSWSVLSLPCNGLSMTLSRSLSAFPALLPHRYVIKEQNLKCKICKMTFIQFRCPNLWRRSLESNNSNLTNTSGIPINIRPWLKWTFKFRYVQNGEIKNIHTK